MSDVRDLVFGPCQTCLRPICQCPAKHTTPPDAQAMPNLMATTDAKVWAVDFIQRFSERRADIDEGLMIAWFASAIMCGHDSQAETIRQLEDLLESAKENERFLRDTPWLQENASLQARLTASEAKLKWTTVRPTVAGWYWWRTTNVPATIIELREMGNVVIVPMKTGEWQGPITPGEE